MALYKNDNIINYFRSEDVAHAVLIEGAAGSGKLTVARHAAAALACDKVNAPCLECSFCERIISGEFPDVCELIERDPSCNISVESVRELLYNANIVPGEANCRVFIIGDLERIQIYAQNALLKVLEEPPKNVYFILLAQSKSSVLPTILSRTVHFRTELLDKELIFSKLCELYPDKAQEAKHISTLACGSLGKAMEYMEDGSLTEPYNIAKSYITAAAAGTSLTAMSAIIPPLKTKRESLPALMSALTEAVRDVMALKSGAQALYLELPDSVKFIPDRKLSRALEIMNEISRDHRNINITSALTRLNMVFASK